MSPRPRRFKEGRQISLRLESDLLEDLDAKAEEYGIDRSQLISLLLKRHIGENPWILKDPPSNPKKKNEK
jgi:metal-responsive CopG/Arc/MetJ family transcriptional regulator